ncbi:MAG: hypothetical protein ACRCYQ_08585 [Nocardioides sp.]
MRTTVTLDADTEQIVRARMKAKGVSFKRALNDSIRESRAAARATSPRYVVEPMDLGMPLVDLTKALSLAGELEDAEIVRKLQSGR